jgi:MoxR-like ATPase
MSRWRAVVRGELETIDNEYDNSEITLTELKDRIIPRLEEEFPENDHLEAGLRRTLQELRDDGEIEFLGDGSYRLTLEATPPFRDLFEEALHGYSDARTEGNWEHTAAKLIDSRIPHEITTILGQEHISVKSSVGTGVMANIPWIGVFDTRLTTSPKKGLYVVYLFDSAADVIYLTLNQGMTELQESFGRSEARSILEDRAEALRTVVDLEGFKNGPIELTPDLLTSRNSLYGSSTICYRAYELGSFPESAVLADDVSRLVSEYQRLIEQGYYETLLDAFDRDATTQENPFDGEGLPPVDEYEGVTEATEDVLSRIDASTVTPEAFHWRLSTSIVTAWTDPLTKIAVQTDSEITPDEAVLIDQIAAVYDDTEPWLTETAEELGVGSLFALDPPQVLYMALLRDLQSEIPEISQVNVNHVKLKTILNDEYTVRPPGGDDAEAPDHPLLTAIDEASGDCMVHHFAAPPDYWLTALRARAVSFPPNKQERWRRIQPGDVALIHSRAEPGMSALDEQPNGFIAAGILGDRFEKEEPWWWDELEGDETFPHLVSFERLFVTGAFDQLDEAATIGDQATDAIASDIQALTTNVVDFTAVDQRCREETGQGLGAQGAYSTFQDDGTPTYDRPRIVLEELAAQLMEISPVNFHRGLYPTLSTELLDGLYFPEGQDEEILQEIEAALRGGKHVILTGPPGTGKTEIAQQVVSALEQSHPATYTGSQVTTATADWSTFDTVGGYMPSEQGGTDGGEELSFTAGTVLNRLRRREPDVQVNEPLVIDELNRADIDKAFGQLFTVLSGQPVTLPYTRDGEEIEILPADELTGAPQRNQYVIPESWRLFATMNTYDKTSLYEMSYAFMRRFAFIRVGTPSLDELDGQELEELVDAYVAVWEADDLSIGLPSTERRAIGEVWQKTNAAVEDRAIGPAIVRDMALYLDNHSNHRLAARLTQAVIAYVFPQLEGVPRRQQIVDGIASVDQIDAVQLRSVASEMLQITFEES